jgi:leader peptidase (prepilin peptidase)/N-methyltransferase
MTDAVIALLAGLLIGSFLNVCIYRLPRDLSIVRPRSFCPACERTIAWYDNVPVLSFLVLRGRCRHCREPIPLRYPVVELATAILFSWTVYEFGPSLSAFKLCLFEAILVTLIAADFEERILPDEFTLGGVAAGLILAWFAPLRPGLSLVVASSVHNPRALSLIEAAIGASVGAGALWLVAKIYEVVRRREGMGLGDVKMVAMIGAFLGLQGALLTLIAGSIAGGAGGLIYITATRKNPSTYELPFGSFLGLAALAMAVFGDAIVRWYLHLGG